MNYRIRRVRQNCARSIAFYRDMLDFDLLSTWEDGGEVRFAVVRHGPVEMMLNQPGEGAGPRSEEPYGDLMLFFEVESV